MEDFRIVAKLNSGTSGTVFKAVRLRDGEEVVIKRVPLVDMDPDQRQQARMEVSLMRQLHHPHIATYHDAFLFEDEDLCIVMQYFRGGDLASFLDPDKRGGSTPLPEQQVMLWFVEIALALHYLHSHRIIHRDLKTQNILLDPDTNEVSVGDFGIAKILETAHTVTSTPSGTPLYMAPEVLQGNMCTFKSDVWSLGCILYELLCFKHPFEAHDISGLVIKIIRGEYPPIPRCYSRQVVRLVARMLERDPRRRPLIDEILMAPYVRSYVHTYFSVRSPKGGPDHPCEVVLYNQMDVLGVSKVVVDVRAEFMNTHSNTIGRAQIGSGARGGHIVQTRASLCTARR